MVKPGRGYRPVLVTDRDIYRLGHLIVPAQSRPDLMLLLVAAVAIGARRCIGLPLGPMDLGLALLDWRAAVSGKGPDRSLRFQEITDYRNLEGSGQIDALLPSSPIRIGQCNDSPVFAYNVFVTERFLKTKLFIPPLPPNLVLRPRLIERLNRELHLECKLSLISGPAGSGKITGAGERAAG